MKCIVTKWNEKEGNELTANGLIRVNTKKPEYGSLMLMAVVVSLSGSFMNKRNKIGFIVGNVDDLKAVIEEYKLVAGTDYSVAVSPHRIVTLELLKSNTPEDQGYREKINPSTGEVLVKAGDPIMWKTEVVAEGSDVVESLIQHDALVEVPDAAVAEFTGEAKVEAKK